jgi:hypothetical protein
MDFQSLKQIFLINEMCLSNVTYTHSLLTGQLSSSYIFNIDFGEK